MVVRQFSKLSAGVRFPVPAQILEQNLSEAQSVFDRTGPLSDMYKVYILQSLKDKRTYVGYTKDFEERLKKHNSGQVRSTKYRTPFKILFTESFDNIKDAKSRELWWKSKTGRNKLKEYFSNL